ncbi:hypothetical protein Amal_04052 [Acetobacter malorum]|uniref:Uncharacterized protein n=1 Tax=Acetobacter malorum TaxID=178901 RepID=A0A177FV09_9PROT|nr:hypothetical protein Amal_04052 [Acetobacter malorum]
MPDAPECERERDGQQGHQRHRERHGPAQHVAKVMVGGVGDQNTDVIVGQIQIGYRHSGIMRGTAFGAQGMAGQITAIHKHALQKIRDVVGRHRHTGGRLADKKRDVIAGYFLGNGLADLGWGSLQCFNAGFNRQNICPRAAR